MRNCPATQAELEQELFRTLSDAFRDWIGALNGFTPDPKLFLHNLVDAAADNRVIPMLTQLPSFLAEMRPMIATVFGRIERYSDNPRKLLHSVVEHAAATYVPKGHSNSRNPPALRVVDPDTRKETS